MFSLNNLKFLQKSTIISIISKHHDHKSHVNQWHPVKRHKRPVGRGLNWPSITQRIVPSHKKIRYFIFNHLDKARIR